MDYVVLQALEICRLSVSQFLISILTSRQYDNHPLLKDLLKNSGAIFSAVVAHPLHQTNEPLINWCTRNITKTYQSELFALTSKHAGWHFNARSTTTKQLEEFDIKTMAQDIGHHAPKLWDFLGTLVRLAMECGGHQDGGMEADIKMGLEGTSDQDHGYWEEIEEINLEGFIDILTLDEEGTASGAKNGRADRRSAQELMTKLLIISVLMHCMNQKVNPLQSILGIFMQSAHTPQKVIDTLARLGISISMDSINAAVRSLSAESQKTLRDLGQSLLASYAYDNFDIDLKTQTPTIEKSNDSLKHLTSGLLFPLVHGVTTDDLKSSEALWKVLPLNQHIRSGDVPPKRTWKDLVNLHPEPRDSIISRRDRFNSWMFLRDLCTYGPEYFRQFLSELSEPELVEQIPLVKTPIYAARAMDVNNSTVSGNICSVIELLAQGGINDPASQSASEIQSPDISEHVVLVHGDLGTGERLCAAQLRRSIESTPWNRLQHIIFLPGLFHLKMACADALWRTFILPPAAREDETCLMHNVAHLQPKETGIYSSKPGFRRMHQLVGHAGTCRRLDCWRVHIANKFTAYPDLDAFTQSEPTLDDLKAIADEMVHVYMATHRLQRERQRPSKERDMQFENSQLLHKYFLLYEELSHAMNSGDIGRVETCIVSWIPILKAVGKHKYATHMTKFLIDVHFLYSPGLRRAICYHLLVNPTGKPMKWRAVDWCVELNNLFTKVKNGGKGPNRTVDHVLLESPLVQVYCNIQVQVQKNFRHTHITTQHSQPDMRRTFDSLCEKLAKSSPHTVLLGRTSSLGIVDLNDKGREMMDKHELPKGELEREDDSLEEDTAQDIAEMDDVVVELL